MAAKIEVILPSSFTQTRVLSQQLQHIQACTDVLPLRYNDCTQDISIDEKLLEFQKMGGHHHIHKNREHIYCLEVVKNILLTQLELLCVSSELENDVETSFSECKKICELTEEWISLCPRNNGYNNKTCSLKLQFSDFSKRIIKSRSRLISQSILNLPSQSTLVSLVKFESVLVRALLGIFATFTSLLSPPSVPPGGVVCVSDEMFALAQGRGKLTWKDCLIPGGQSEGVRVAGEEVSGCVWREVGRRVLESVQPVMVGGWAVSELVPSLERLLKIQELQAHPAVVKCLWYVITSVRQQVSLLHWDSGFQCLLVSMSVDLKRGFKCHSNQHKTTQSTWLLTQCVLTPLTASLHSTPQQTNHSPTSIAHHLDTLRLSQPLVAAMEVTLRHFSIFLSQGMKSCLVNWNLRGLGQGLFVDVPALRRVLRDTLSCSMVAAPLFAFPRTMGPHLVEATSRQSYTLFYQAYKSIQEASDGLCVCLTRVWAQHCAQLLYTVLPASQKAWRSSMSKSEGTPVKASSYCEVIIEQLLSPLLEACLSLSPDGQKALAALCVTVLLLEFRRVILRPDRTYKPSIGRQLLTDYQHLLHWLDSNSRTLSKDLSTIISSLPLVSELEHGLQTLAHTTSGELQEGGVALSSLLPSTQLPLYTELAWLNHKDWTRVMTD